MNSFENKNTKLKTEKPKQKPQYQEEKKNHKTDTGT